MRKGKMKVCAGLVLISALVVSAGAASVTAKPSDHRVYVDYEQVNVTAYEINGNNYFKLRDIAAILSGTDAQFEVTWDQATGNITLTDGQPYTPVGGELGTIPAVNQAAEDSTAPVFRDGERVYYTGYEINGSNYYKLRDIAADFDFIVTWDSVMQSVMISTDEKPDYIWESKIPEVGTYNDEYEAYLESTGEKIVTVTVDYYTIDGNTNTYYAYGGFPAVVWTLGPREYANNNDSPFDQGYYFACYTFWVDESGKGTFEFKMPRSLYEKTINGNCYYFVRGGLGAASSYVTIDGNRYSSLGAHIEDRNLGADRNPIRLDIHNYGPMPVIIDAETGEILND